MLAGTAARPAVQTQVHARLERYTRSNACIRYTVTCKYLLDTRITLASSNMRGFLRVQVFDERWIQDCQAIREVECDSSGEEPTIVKVFVAMNLCSMQGAPKECL